ncbi:WXG100 family type VII secretion target [Actinomyces oricola]
MTMANISASYDEMNQQAASLRSTRDNIQQMLQQARMQVDNLVSSGFVTDSASGAFQANYQEFTTSATKTIDSLTSISSNLDKIVSVMRETDQNLANQIRA